MEDVTKLNIESYAQALLRKDEGMSKIGTMRRALATEFGFDPKKVSKVSSVIHERKEGSLIVQAYMNLVRIVKAFQACECTDLLKSILDELSQATGVTVEFEEVNGERKDEFIKGIEEIDAVMCGEVCPYRDSMIETQKTAVEAGIVKKNLDYREVIATYVNKQSEEELQERQTKIHDALHAVQQ